MTRVAPPWLMVRGHPMSSESSSGAVAATVPGCANDAAVTSRCSCALVCALHEINPTATRMNASLLVNLLVNLLGILLGPDTTDRNEAHIVHLCAARGTPVASSREPPRRAARAPAKLKRSIRTLAHCDFGFESSGRVNLRRVRCRETNFFR